MLLSNVYARNANAPNRSLVSVLSDKSAEVVIEFAIAGDGIFTTQSVKNTYHEEFVYGSA
jgi:hypothetical protein